MFDKEKQVNVNFSLNQRTSWCINYNQYIQNKTKNKLHMKGMLQTGKKATKKVKKNKNNFINIVRDKFTMSNR